MGTDLHINTAEVCCVQDHSIFIKETFAAVIVGNAL